MKNSFMVKRRVATVQTVALVKIYLPKLVTYYDTLRRLNPGEKNYLLRVRRNFVKVQNFDKVEALTLFKKRNMVKPSLKITHVLTHTATFKLRERIIYFGHVETLSKFTTAAE